MRNFIPLLFATIVMLFFGGIELLLLRFLNKSWWEKTAVRRTAYLLPLLGTLSVLLWGLSEYYQINWLTSASAIWAIVMTVMLVALMASLPLSGVVHFMRWIAERFDSKRQRVNGAVNGERRIFLKGTAVALPLITTSTALGGVTRAFAGARVEKKKLFFEHLPNEFDGLRILHLSDIHLRHYVTLGDLEETLSKASSFSPDMIVLTGDIADDTSLLPDALAMVDQLGAQYGCFGTLGNHEYFRGVARVRQVYDRSPVRLLVNEGLTLQSGTACFYLGGLDDPRFLGGNGPEFYQKGIDKTLAGAGNDIFTLLLSHRPDALDYASSVGVDMTLAGHTHGGQVGFMGRSAFEQIWPHRYLWGHYYIGKSQLYTSSGMGHWFPFRLGCPPEAPLIELKKV